MWGCKQFLQSMMHVQLRENLHNGQSRGQFAFPKLEAPELRLLSKVTILYRVPFGITWLGERGPPVISICGSAVPIPQVISYGLS